MEPASRGTQTSFARVFPPLPQGFNEPFWYGSLQSFWLYYQRRPDDVAARLPDGLETAQSSSPTVSGRARLARLPGLHGPRRRVPRDVHEVEFNVYAYPRARVPGGPRADARRSSCRRGPDEDDRRVPAARALRQPERGQGGDRAVRRAEVPRRSSTYATSRPSTTPASSRGTTPSTRTPAPEAGPAACYSIDGRPAEHHAAAANPSPLIEYGTLEHEGRQHVVANWWNFYGPFMTFDLQPRAPSACRWGIGPEPDPRGLTGTCATDRRPAARSPRRRSPPARVLGVPRWFGCRCERAARARSSRCRRELTGFREVDTAGTGQAREHLDRVLAVAGDEPHGRLLATPSAEHALRRPRPRPARAQRDRALVPRPVGPDAACTGATATAPRPPTQAQVASAAAFREGLVWPAIGAHPIGAKPPGFGSWASRRPAVMSDYDVVIVGRGPVRGDRRRRAGRRRRGAC